MRPRWITNCASFAERRYELRPCHRSSFVRWLNCVTEKSAANEACFPSFPTMPTPRRGIAKSMARPTPMRVIRTNVCSLDHANIIATISDATYPLPSVFANETSDISLLCWRTAACDDSRELRCNFDELVLEEVQTELERTSVSAIFTNINCCYKPAMTPRQSRDSSRACSEEIPTGLGLPQRSGLKSLQM